MLLGTWVASLLGNLLLELKGQQQVEDKDDF